MLVKQGCKGAVFCTAGTRDLAEVPLRSRMRLTLVTVDSPMATAATTLYQKHRKLLRLAARETGTLCDGVTVIITPQQSEKLSRTRYPHVIISASGMATVGRVLHHLKSMTPNPRNHVVFPGFQVGGTRGAKLVGSSIEVKIFGDYVAVKASDALRTRIADELGWKVSVPEHLSSITA